MNPANELKEKLALARPDKTPHSWNEPKRKTKVAQPSKITVLSMANWVIESSRDAVNAEAQTRRDVAWIGEGFV